MDKKAINAFNEKLRANPGYREFLTGMGVDPDRAIKLTSEQRKLAASWVRANIGDIGDLQIDPAGNVNTDHGFSAAIKNPIVLGGLAAGSMLIPGVGPAVLGALSSAGSAA